MDFQYSPKLTRRTRNGMNWGAQTPTYILFSPIYVLRCRDTHIPSDSDDTIDSEREK